MKNTVIISGVIKAAYINKNYYDKDTLILELKQGDLTYFAKSEDKDLMTLPLKQGVPVTITGTIGARIIDNDNTLYSQNIVIDTLSLNTTEVFNQVSLTGEVLSSVLVGDQYHICLKSDALDELMIIDVIRSYPAPKGNIIHIKGMLAPHLVTKPLAGDINTIIDLPVNIIKDTV